MNLEEFMLRERVLMIKKKAQEEMIGFVMIMLVMAIIFVVFLGIYLRKPVSRDRTESAEVSQFLDSLFQYTTECSYDSGYSYENIEDLVVDCFNGKNCPAIGKKACDVLEQDIKKITEASWNFGTESPETGYEYKILYTPAGTENYGTLSNDFNAPFHAPCNEQVGGRGAEKPVYVPNGEIKVVLRICS